MIKIVFGILQFCHYLDPSKPIYSFKSTKIIKLEDYIPEIIIRIFLNKNNFYIRKKFYGISK